LCWWVFLTHQHNHQETNFPAIHCKFKHFPTSQLNALINPEN
jgi:hypothetical protein